MYSAFNVMETNFIKDLNESMKQGLPPPKSKKGELVPKVAVSLHILERLFQIVTGRRTVMDQEISIDTFNKALYFIDIVEQQKEVFSTVSIIVKNIYLG